MTNYVLLSQILRAKSIQQDNLDAAVKYRALIAACSAALEVHTNRRFDHRLETVAHSALPLGVYGDIDGDELLLRDDLQHVTTLTNGDGAVLANDVYELTYAPQQTHITSIALRDGRWTAGNQRPQTAIKVAGVWGYGGTWYKSGFMLSSSLTAESATVALSAAPETALEAEMILRVGTEYLRITADPAPAATSIEVERAVNGSTAAVHNAGAQIERFAPHPFVEHVCKRLVLWQAELESYPVWGKVAVGDFQAAVDLSQVPRDLAVDLTKLLRNKADAYTIR